MSLGKIYLPIILKLSESKFFFGFSLKDLISFGNDFFGSQKLNIPKFETSEFRIFSVRI